MYEIRDHKFVARKFATIFVVIGFDDEENELAMFEFSKFVIMILDLIFGNACELDVCSNSTNIKDTNDIDYISN